MSSLRDIERKAMEKSLFGSRAGASAMTIHLGNGDQSSSPDVLIKVEDFLFYLHKVPLANHSPVLRKLIEDHSSEEYAVCAFTLDEIPGGARSFAVIAKFCYGEKIKLTSSNAVPILCAAYYLNMRDDDMTENLITQTEQILSNKILSSWKLAMRALRSCDKVMVQAEELDIVSWCLVSLAYMVKYDKPHFPENKQSSELMGSGLNWWHRDVCSLSLYLFKRLIALLGAMRHDPVDISNAVTYYASKFNPALDPNFTGMQSVDERMLLEVIVSLLPEQKGVTSTGYLFRMLCTAIELNANMTCIDSLERRIGAQLDELC